MARSDINPGLYNTGAIVLNTKPFYDSITLQRQKVDKENTALDEELKNNVANAKDADIPDIVNHFQAYKASKMNELFDRKTKNDPQAYTQAQISSAKNYAQAYQAINESKNTKDMIGQMVKDRSIPSHAHDYSDDFYALVSLAQKLPTSKMHSVDIGKKDEHGNPIMVDLTNPDTYRSNATYYNPNNDLKDLKGKETTNDVNEGFTDNTKAQTKYTPYKFNSTTGDDYKTMFANTMNGSADAQTFYKQQFAKLTPQDIQNTIDTYNKLPDSHWTLKGQTKPRLAIKNPDSYTDVISTLAAMNNEISNVPRPQSPKMVDNKGIDTQQKQNFELKKLNIEAGNARSLAQFKHGLDTAPGTGPSVLNNRVDKIITTATKQPSFTIGNLKGEKMTAYPIPKDEQINAIITPKGQKNADANFYVEKNGEHYIYSVYYKKTVSADGTKYTGIEKQNGKPVINEEKSSMIPIEEFRNSLGKKMFSGKQLEKELNIPYTPASSGAGVKPSGSWRDRAKKVQ